MQTLKIKYTTEEQSSGLIREYRKQYSHVLHFAFNRWIDGFSRTVIEHMIPSLNNIPLIKSYLRQCAVKNASQLLKSREDDEEIKVIFGGRNNCVRRAKGLITREEYREKRIGKLFIVGESNQRANRMVRINEDIDSFTFFPARGTKIQLTIAGGYRRYKPILKKLHELQESKAAPITYSLDSEYIYVTYDELLLATYKPQKPLKNRVFAIDLNPNYVGWSVVDWNSSNDFHIVDKGVISAKLINDADFALKEKKLPSDSPERLYLNNKRTYEVFEICKLLVNKARHYRCELFIAEELKIKSRDNSKGAKYNKLVNNLWSRDKMVMNLKKRCGCYGQRFMTVPAQYSSFIGNFLYRNLNLLDMVLASLEVGRRGYEFHSQYIAKEKEERKNIVIPEVSDFGDWYFKSLEEFDILGGIVKPVEVYEYLKESKHRYRLSLEGFDRLEFSRCFSHKSKIVNVFVINDKK